MRFAFAIAVSFVSTSLFAQVDSLLQERHEALFLSLPDSFLLKIHSLTLDETRAEEPVVGETTQRDTVTVIGVGDIMMGTNYPEEYAALPPDNGSGLLSAVEGILADADLTFGNLEGVLIDSGGVAKRCRNPDVCYVFRSPTSFAQNLVHAGFDAISLANNHSGDFGDIGRQTTATTLREANIAYAGHLDQPFTIIERNGVRFGFTALAPNEGCVYINDIENAQAIVTHLDSISDVVIVSFHGGAEGPDYQHVPREHEMFVGEDRGDVYHLSHALIDAGADIIFGHGPHVTRAIEVYKERFIAYSLGNFCTYNRINLRGVNGLAPIIKVFTSSQGAFISAHITPIRQVPRTPVMLDESAEVIKVMRNLTQEDFPEGSLTIDDNGWVNFSTM